MIKDDIVNEGCFLRNLKKKGEATKRYPGDDNDSPLYGLKLSSRFWRNGSSNGDMSINEQRCVASESCSIAIHPQGREYYHVAILNLTELNGAMKQHAFIAQYDPLEDAPNGPNACHFELLPLNGSAQSLHALQAELDKPFPPGKMPDGDKSRLEAASATEAKHSYVSESSSRGFDFSRGTYSLGRRSAILPVSAGVQTSPPQKPIATEGVRIRPVLSWAVE